MYSDEWWYLLESPQTTLDRRTMQLNHVSKESWKGVRCLKRLGVKIMAWHWFVMSGRGRGRGGRGSGKGGGGVPEIKDDDGQYVAHNVSGPPPLYPVSPCSHPPHCSYKSSHFVICLAWRFLQGVEFGRIEFIFGLQPQFLITSNACCVLALIYAFDYAFESLTLFYSSEMHLSQVLRLKRTRLCTLQQIWLFPGKPWSCREGRSSWGGYGAQGQYHFVVYIMKSSNFLYQPKAILCMKWESASQSKRKKHVSWLQKLDKRSISTKHNLILAFSTLRDRDSFARNLALIRLTDSGSAVESWKLWHG